ncbi:MAG: SDR family NAD(P)-dependent oxidoreductase [Polyangiaceae bacterium]
MSTAAVLGVGPGLGAALARRFARGEFDVALMARSEASLASVELEVTSLGRRARSILVDAGDNASVAAAFERAKAELAHPKCSSTTPVRFGKAVSSTPHQKNSSGVCASIARAPF